jgi:hypothetical protein
MRFAARGLPAIGHGARLLVVVPSLFTRTGFSDLLRIDAAFGTTAQAVIARVGEALAAFPAALTLGLAESDDCLAQPADEASSSRRSVDKAIEMKAEGRGRPKSSLSLGPLALVAARRFASNIAVTSADSMKLQPRHKRLCGRLERT